MARARIEPGKVGTPAVVPLDQDAAGKWVVRPRPLAADGSEQDYPKGTKAGQWRGLVRARHFDGAEPFMVRVNAASQAAARNRAVAKAEQTIRDRVAELDAQAVQSAKAAEGETVGELADRYLTIVERGELRANTKADYRLACRRIRASELADLTTPRVTVAKVRQALTDVAESHGTTAAQQVRKVLTHVLDIAVDAELIPMNPVRAFRGGIPKVSKRQTGIDTKRSPSEHEVAVLLWGLYHDPEALPMASVLDADTRRSRTRNGAAGTSVGNGLDVADLTAMLFSTGLRVGEALALRWSDLDLDSKVAVAVVSGTTIYLPPEKDDDGTIVTKGRTVRQEATKTEGSIRSVPLAPRVQAMLRRRARTFGIDLTALPETPVFGSPQKPTDYRDRHNLSRTIKRLYTRHGLDYGRTHAGRHFVITRLSDRGLSTRKIAAVVGHSELITTLRYVSKGSGIDAETLRAL